jgi:hypothetical protein
LLWTISASMCATTSAAKSKQAQKELGLIFDSFYRGKLNSKFYSPQKLDFFLIIFLGWNKF